MLVTGAKQNGHGSEHFLIDETKWIAMMSKLESSSFATL